MPCPAGGWCLSVSEDVLKDAYFCFRRDIPKQWEGTAWKPPGVRLSATPGHVRDNGQGAWVLTQSYKKDKHPTEFLLRIFLKICLRLFYSTITSPSPICACLKMDNLPSSAGDHRLDPLSLSSHLRPAQCAVVPTAGSTFHRWHRRMSPVTADISHHVMSPVSF